MRAPFLLFQSHLDLAHNYWKLIVKQGDIIIDATCGNGKDTLKLAEMSLQEEKGLLYAYDIQPQAITTTRNYLSNNLSSEEFLRIRFVPESHVKFSDAIKFSSVKLIVYNLGYLPGGDKNITTLASDTLSSLQCALELIMQGGAICVTCYPGHPTGLEEEKSVLDFAASLEPTIWSSCHHKWLNRRNAPSLLLLQKKVDH